MVWIRIFSGASLTFDGVGDLGDESNNSGSEGGEEEKGEKLQLRWHFSNVSSLEEGGVSWKRLPLA